MVQFLGCMHACTGVCAHEGEDNPPGVGPCLPCLPHKAHALRCRPADTTGQNLLALICRQDGGLPDAPGVLAGEGGARRWVSLCPAPRARILPTGLAWSRPTHWEPTLACPLTTHGGARAGRHRLGPQPIPLHTAVADVQAPTPRRGRVRSRAIRGTDGTKLPVDGHAADRAVSARGVRAGRLGSFDHFNLLHAACLPHSPGTCIKPCEGVLIFLFSLWDKKTES